MSYAKASSIVLIIFSSVLFISGCNIKVKNQRESTSGLEAKVDFTALTTEVEVENRYIAIDNVCAWPNHQRYHMGVVIWEM